MVAVAAMGTPRTDSGSRARGRPRSLAADAAIRATVVDLLGRHGYHQLRVDDVASQSGVSKTTIYRRYPTKASLVVGVLETIKAEQIPIPETGSIVDDVRSLIRSLYESLDGTAVARALPGLLAEKAGDPELASAIDGLWSSRQAKVSEVIERAVAEGSIHPDVSIGDVVQLIAAPAYYRLLVTGRPLDRESADRHADVLTSLLLGEPG